MTSVPHCLDLKMFLENILRLKIGERFLTEKLLTDRIEKNIRLPTNYLKITKMSMTTRLCYILTNQF